MTVWTYEIHFESFIAHKSHRIESHSTVYRNMYVRVCYLPFRSAKPANPILKIRHAAAIATVGMPQSTPKKRETIQCAFIVGFFFLLLWLALRFIQTIKWNCKNVFDAVFSAYDFYCRAEGLLLLYHNFYMFIHLLKENLISLSSSWFTIRK